MKSSKLYLFIVLTIYGLLIVQFKNVHSATTTATISLRSETSSNTTESEIISKNDPTENDVTTVESVDKDLPSFGNSTDESMAVITSVTGQPLTITTIKEATVTKDDDGELETDDDGDYDANEDSDTDGTFITDLNKDAEENVEEEYYNNDEDDDDDDDDDDGDDENENEDDGEYEEKRCTLKTYLSNMNITAMFPEDRNALRVEYETLMQDNDPQRIRFAPSVNHTFQRLNRLMNLARNIANRQEVRSGITNFLHHNFDLFLELELGSACINSIISILVAIRRSELWSLKFFDSAPKLPSGIMTGVGSYLGNFDQCISIESPTSISESYEGQYCIVKPVLPLPETESSYNINEEQQSDEKLIEQVQRILNFYSHYNVEQYLKTNPVLKFVEIMKSNKGRVTNFAICLPNSCGAEQLELALNKFLYPIIGIPLEIQESSCWTKTKIQDYSLYIDGYAQFSLTIIGILLILVLISTFYEIYPWFFQNYHNYQQGDIDINNTSQKIKVIPSKINSIVSIFSAVGNTKRLLTSSSPSYPHHHRLIVFDTLRFVIIILIGLSNAFYLIPLSQALHNISESVPHEILTNPKYFFIRAPSLFNDGLLIIAGALFVRSIFRHLIQPHDTLTYLLYFVRRWIRLTFPIFGSILFLYLLPSTGYGPLWYRLMEILMPACNSPSSLASTLFHYSNWNFVKLNYTNDESYVVCNPDTWFISIIFQLNLAFFIVVLVMYQSPKKGLRLLIIFIIASILFNISPRMFFSNTRTYYEFVKQPSLWHVRRSFYLYHQNIIQYIGSFSIGLLLGYAIIVNENITKDPKSNNHYRNHKKTLICNSLAFLGLVVPFVWVNQFFVENQELNELSVLLFFSIGRFIFSLSFAWIIYVCVSKKSPFLHSCLTPSSIQPVARLSFAIFLIQPLVQYHRMYSSKETYVMTFRNTIEHYFCDLIISIFFSYLLYLLFEAPAYRLSDLFRWRRQTIINDINSFGNGDAENKKYWCNNLSLSSNNNLEKNDNIDNKQKNLKESDYYEQNGIISIRF